MLSSKIQYRASLPFENLTEARSRVGEGEAAGEGEVGRGEREREAVV